jgi:hypothetical protein
MLSTGRRLILREGQKRDFKLWQEMSALWEQDLAGFNRSAIPSERVVQWLSPR